MHGGGRPPGEEWKHERRRSQEALPLRPVYQESSWKQHEEKIAGFVFKLEVKLRCALTGKLTATEDLECEGSIVSSQRGRMSLVKTGKEIGSELGCLT